MPLHTCIGVKQNGNRCTTVVFAENTRCGVHINTLNKVGPNTIRRRELKYIHNKNISAIYRENEHNPVVTHRLKVQETLRYERELLELNTIIAQETEANGDVDRDIEVRQRAAARIRAHREEWDRIRRLHRAAVQLRPVPVLILPQREDNLARIAHDRQNVHTELVVNKVKATINTVLTVPVPPEYETETLKTSGEIILECKLSKRSAWQMMAKYCGDEDIYDMGNGIYAKVLNSVWQYIKASPDAEDLKKILAAEMEDNVGMCAQGNLSRLCNILSGYMEGLEVEEKSKNQIIGERFSAIANNPDERVRLTEGTAILQELNVPDEEWPIWLEPLLDD